jgi:hypothetical protein
MKRGALVLLAAFAISSTVSASTSRRPIIVTSQDHSLVDADDCNHFHTQNSTSLPATASAQEDRKVRLTEGDILKIRAINEGGVSVKGWDRPFASLTVCKSAEALSATQAKTALGKIKVAVRNGEIVTTGPELNQTQTWWAHIILRVPNKATLDVAAANGGIAIRNMTGRITARTTNGGISLASCTGDHHVTTENGGISLDKISGRTNAVSQNGPISLKLRDLVIPPIEAQTEDTGEILCNLKGCSDGLLGSWTPNRKHLRIGAAAPSIRLTSYSADIMIEQVR